MSIQRLYQELVLVQNGVVRRQVELFLYPPGQKPRKPEQLVHPGASLLADVVFHQDFSAPWEILCDYLEEHEGCARPLLLTEPLTGWKLYQYLWEHRAEHIFWFGANVRKDHSIRLILKTIADNGYAGWYSVRTTPGHPIPCEFFFGRSLVVVDTFARKLDNRYYWGDIPEYL